MDNRDKKEEQLEFNFSRGLELLEVDHTKDATIDCFGINDRRYSSIVAKSIAEESKFSKMVDRIWNSDASVTQRVGMVFMLGRYLGQESGERKVVKDLLGKMLDDIRRITDK